MNTRSSQPTTRNRWLNWEPKVHISAESAESEPTKPSKPGCVGFVGATPAESPEIEAELGKKIDTSPAEHTKPEPLEAVLKGQTVELWSDSAERLFLVADEEDSTTAMDRYGARRGEVYTAAEAQRIVTVADPRVVREIHAWKRRFDGTVREFQEE
jgi:hypothetical protein